VRPTRLGTLVALAVVCALLVYLVAQLGYGSLPALPAFAPVSLVLLAVVEIGMARVVRDRMTGRRTADGRPRGRPLHPMQVARAAVLAKASSPTGAVLFGAYAGLLGYVLPRRGELSTWANDALVSAVSAAACLALVVAALLLERACRTPADPA
jgi:FtsH-binding integral membrane protein